MCKTDRKIKGYEGKLRIGERAVIVLLDGRRASTSPVLNFFVDCWGHGKMETQNSIYRF